MNPTEPNMNGTVQQDSLGLIGETAQEFGWNLLFQQAQDIQAFRQDMNRLDVAVLGRFKAGKSSLLNAMLGRSVLPVDVLPATAIVTRIESGDRDGAKVLFQDNRVEETDLSNLDGFITEKGNPHNTKGVVRVEIQLEGVPLPSIRWVDTPGLGSIHTHNTEVSRKWLARVGAALLTISVDQPLSEDDLELLQDLREITPEIIIVLTKVDMVAEADLVAVRSFIARQIREKLGVEYPLFSVSNRPGHEKRLEEFRAYLAGHLAEDYEVQANRIFDHKMKGLEATCDEYLRVALTAAQAGEETRAGLTAALREEWEHLALVDQEFENLKQDFSCRVREAIEGRFLACAGDLTTVMRSDLYAEMAGWKGFFHQECQRFNDWMQDRLTREVSRVGRETHDTWRTILGESEEAVRRVVEAYRSRIAERVEKALGRKFESAQFDVDIPRPDTPTLHLGRIFDTPFELLWFIIPMSLVRRPLHQRFMDSIAWEVEKHLRRFSSEWTEAFDHGFERVVSIVDRMIREELDMLGVMARSQPGERAKIDRALEKMKMITAIPHVDIGVGVQSAS